MAVANGVADTAAGVDGDVAGLREGLDNLFGGGVADHFFGSGDRSVR